MKAYFKTKINLAAPVHTVHNEHVLHVADHIKVSFACGRHIEYGFNVKCLFASMK